jgi:hypothetical protein
MAAYPLTISGKPHFAWPALIPITFELGVLGGALGAVFGMLGSEQLPMHHHPLFESERVRALLGRPVLHLDRNPDDPEVRRARTADLLRAAGAHARRSWGAAS